MVNADYYYPEWGCLVDFFAIWGWKWLAWAAGDWTHNRLDLCSQSGTNDQSAKINTGYGYLLKPKRYMKSLLNINMSQEHISKCECLLVCSKWAMCQLTEGRGRQGQVERFKQVAKWKSWSGNCWCQETGGHILPYWGRKCFVLQATLKWCLFRNHCIFHFVLLK